MNHVNLINIRIVVWVLLLSFLIFGNGCSTTTITRTYSQEEVGLIPRISMEKVLTASSNEEVIVRSKSFKGSGFVSRMDGLDHVIVNALEDGQAQRTAVNDIMSIKRIRRLEISGDFSGENTAAAIGEVVILAPLIPVGILMAATPLDAKKYEADEEKAHLAYYGLNKDELLRYVGAPDGEFYLTDSDGSIRYEVWHYSRDQVLKGGRYLYLDLQDGEVFHNSAVMWNKDRLMPVRE